MAAKALSHEDYTVGWICALPLEMTAATAMLDKTHTKLPQPPSDHNNYTLGRVSGHNVVITCLPYGVYGTTSATAAISHMQSTFPTVRYALMVGIGGGVPSKDADIRLGDVVVSKPTGTSSGVVQYDYGKTISGGRFQQTGILNQPPPILLTAASHLQSSDMMRKSYRISKLVSDALYQNPDMEATFSRPALERDRLFDAEYDHRESEETCIGCDASQQVNRAPRTSNEPQIHYGIIASGNQVMKDGQSRDRIAKQLHVFCFEMEAAGIMNLLPCLVIRGICDYCDSHKNKQWQGYAALTAAAYAKELLAVIAVNQAKEDKKVAKGCWMVPFERNPRFVGRQNEIMQLEERIFDTDQTRKMAITGLGGVGKTQVALELAYRVREEKPDYSTFWIPSTSIESIEQAYMSISEQVGLQDVTPADVKTRVQAYLSQEAAGRWLLIFDNADDTDMWMSDSNTSSALKTSLPKNPEGFVIFTTRNRKLAVKLASSEVITIPEMDEETAIHVLKKSLIQADLLNDHAATLDLLHRLTFLPLAITQAAAYINENGIGLADYVSLLQEQEEDVIDLLSENFEDEGRYSDIKNPVATTWLISFNQIRRLDRLAADYLSFMACINPRGIPQSLLPTALSHKKRTDALGILNGYSFISIQPGNQFLSLHRLVHLATRNWLRKDENFQQWIMKTGARLNEAFPDDDHKNRILWREYLPHALSILQQREFQSSTEEREELLQKVGQCLHSDGRYDEAEPLFSEVLEKRRERLGKDNQEVLANMAWVASTHRNQGRWKEAEELFVQVIETSKTVLGPEHPSTLSSMANLASIYWNQGRWKEAEELEVQVMEISKTVLGPEHPDTLASMNNLAHT